MTKATEQDYRDAPIGAEVDVTGVGVFTKTGRNKWTPPLGYSHTETNEMMTDYKHVRFLPSDSEDRLAELERENADLKRQLSAAATRAEQIEQAVGKYLWDV